MDFESKHAELFEPDVPLAQTQTPAKTLIGTSETELVNQLNLVRSITAFGELYVLISNTALEKRLNLYVYRRSMGGRFKHRCYWGIYAVKAGNPKTSRSKALEGVVAAIEVFPDQINHHKSSKQYSLLTRFHDSLIAYEAE